MKYIDWRLADEGDVVHRMASLSRAQADEFFHQGAHDIYRIEDGQQYVVYRPADGSWLYTQCGRWTDYQRREQERRPVTCVACLAGGL